MGQERPTRTSWWENVTEDYCETAQNGSFFTHDHEFKSYNESQCNEKLCKE